MAATVLTIDTLGDLDHGSARMVINEAIDAVMRDVDGRGEDGKERILGLPPDHDSGKGER